ncbi:hypothetical protein G4O51_05945 [Candidatus Bathyarchaeota archaeon A05DMB-2]|nr:hypothetical protein [Candidatus Bathyarchaeota archaeon A05DMB-2]
MIPQTRAIGDYWTSLAPIPTARSGLGVAVVDGKIYAIGGRNDAISPYLDTNEMYDPATNTWTTKASMPTPRREFAIAVYKDKIYCIGGEVDDTGGMYFTGINEVYDPATDTWETKAPLLTPRFRMCANIIDGKIYVIGGAQYNVFPGILCSDKNEVHDPEADTWIEKTSIPIAVNRAASAVAGGRIFVLGGETGPFGSAGWHDFNQVYDVENDVWYMATLVPVGFAAAAAATLIFYISMLV